MNDERRPREAPNEKTTGRKSASRVAAGGTPFHTQLRWRRAVARALDRLTGDDRYPNVDKTHPRIVSREAETTKAGERQ